MAFNRLSWGHSPTLSTKEIGDSPAGAVKQLHFIFLLSLYVAVKMMTFLACLKRKKTKKRPSFKNRSRQIEHQVWNWE